MRNINLLPIDYRPAPKFVFKRVFIVLFLSILTLSLIGGYLVLRININQTNKLIDSKKQSIAMIERNLIANQENNSYLESVRDIVATIDGIKSNSTKKASILIELQQHIPNDVNLTNLAIYQEGINFSCQAPNLQSVAELLSSLNTWDRYQGFTIPQISINEEIYVFQVQGHLKRGEE